MVRQPPPSSRTLRWRRSGVADGAYDLIALLDVLEHIEDDKASLASIQRKLSPGGADEGGRS